MIRILFFADLHLASKGPTPQHLALEALSALIRQQKPHLLVSLGDLTLCGDLASGQTLRQALGSLPFLGILGNSDLRSPPQLSELETLLEPSRCWEGEGCRLLLLHLRQGQLLEESRAQLLEAVEKPGQLLLGAHTPPEEWEPESRRLLETYAARRPITFLCGHLHRPFSREMGMGRWIGLGALDPDKSIEGPCQGTMVTLEKGKVLSTKPLFLPLKEKDFRPFLGLSALLPEQLSLAIERRLPALELRWDYPNLFDHPPILELNQWRRQGGICLSLHLPDTFWAENVLKGKGELSAFAALADRLEMQQVTLHPPKGLTAGQLAPVAKELAFALSSLSPNISIAVENQHAAAGQPGHPFGSLPEECRALVTALEQLLPNPIGYRLDLGHARNNPGIYSHCSLGVWMRELGPRCLGYHLHQVALLPEGKMENHQPFSQFYGALISLGGLSTALSANILPAGPLPHGGFAPILLEQRNGEGYPQSLEVLNKHFSDQK